MKIAFNTKLRSIYRVICLEEDDLGNSDLFFQQGNIAIGHKNPADTHIFSVSLVTEKHRIVAPNGISIDLFNNKRAPIDFEILPILIKQHKSDPNFFIEIRAKGPGVYVEQSEVSNNIERCNRKVRLRVIVFNHKFNYRIWTTIYGITIAKVYWKKSNEMVCLVRNLKTYCLIVFAISFTMNFH